MMRKPKPGCFILLVLFLLFILFFVVLSLVARRTTPGWPMRVEGIRLRPLLPLLDPGDIDTDNGSWYLINPDFRYVLSAAEKTEYDAMVAGGDLAACTNLLAWMELNQGWLEPLRKCAGAKTYQVPTITNITAMAVGVSSFLDIQRRLRVWMEKRAQEGEWVLVSEALDLQGQLNQAVSRGGPLINHLVGNAGSRALADAVNHFREQYDLPPEQIQAWQACLRKQAEQRQSLDETFRYELLFAGSAIDTVYGQGLGALTGGGNSLRFFSPLAVFMGSSPKKTRAHFNDYYSHLIHESTLPVYTNHAEAVVENFLTESGSLLWLRSAPIGRVLAAMLVPAIRSSRIAEANTQVQLDLADIGLAIEHWIHRHGAPPAELESLVPEYLAAIPLDLFDPSGAPIRYATQEAAWRVYSVGKNFTDDGGRVPVRFPGKQKVTEGSDHILFSDHEARVREQREGKD